MAPTIFIIAGCWLGLNALVVAGLVRLGRKRRRGVGEAEALTAARRIGLREVGGERPGDVAA